MHPIKTESTNTIYGPPRDADEKVKAIINSLPVTIVDGVMHSFWQPSETDIANILAGIPVRLSILGSVHPALTLAVASEV